MNKLLLTVSLIFIFLNGFSQSCCGELTSPFYTNIIRYDSVYAAAQPTFASNNINLSVRITDASQNTCTKRPLIILLHGGGFSSGTPALMDSVATQFARRGYLTASIQYRLGFKGSTLTCPMDTTELIRAWYRATQDAKSAVRWFKQRNEAFRIDTNLIFAGGWSAGGYTLSGLAWMNDESEKPFQANALNDTLINNTLYTRPDLGSVQGISNLNGYSTTVKGIFSFSSSFMFPNHLDADEQTGILYFNNKLDQYEIPWEDCTQPAWNYLCPNGIPKSCGIESLTETLTSYNIPFQYTLFETTICSHNLHEPCFPMFQQEINEISTFLNDLSDCPITIDIANIKNQNNSKIISLNEEELLYFIQQHQDWTIASSSGIQIKLGKNTQPHIAKGIYVCYNSNPTIPKIRLNVY